ncbi:hypothetical protein [Lacipirellula parvula]|uniref:Uncharacterized protein n=1 Tax=Lacipirellula parvula TaxID=2650471 RepID=A0A5K7XLH3_9BACT|nr:hypothetical protein [Lacipirellula parvula]BBO35343.1 hypothetical protein PLANPX_4955 [Lacipirellula parvula]
MQPANVTASWDGANQSGGVSHAVAEAPVESGPRSVVVRRNDERVAQAGDPFDPFDAEMPATDPEPSPAPATTPAYDPFDDPATETPAEPAINPNSYPQPSLEEAFEEPAVEEPAVEQPPIDQPVEEEEETAEELENARQAIDREMQRREAEPSREAEPLRIQDQPAPRNEIEIAPQTIEEQEEMTEELVAPTEPETSGDESMREEEADDYQLPSAEEYDSLRYRGDLEPLPPTPEELETRRQQIEEERKKSLAECEKLYDNVRSDTLKSISLDIRLQGEAGLDFPFECEGRRPAFQPRNWTPVTYMWKASGLCHKPLYFEQVQVERYGHSWGPVLEPIMSGAHFFGTVPILPYKMGLEAPNECIYSLGYYRPGSCAPYMIEPLGFTWRAAAFQAGAVTGAAFALP